MNSIKLWHRITQISYASLLVLLCGWVLLYPPTTLPLVVVLIAWILPLLFAAPGIFKKKLYTYAWAQFVNMIYFCHAIMFLMSNGPERWIALLELILVLLFFSAAVITIQIAKKTAAKEQSS